MRSLIAVSGALCVGLAACSAGDKAAPAAQFEAATISGSQSQGDDLIKLNTATGEAWVHTRGNTNKVFSKVRDDAAPPPGDYHLVRWDQVDAGGDVNWNVYRFDRSTGHTWILESFKGGYDWMSVNTVN